MFLRNAWYVAAWDHELGDEPKAIRLLEEDVVLYRKTDGTPAALEDACPHRKLPLSMGRIKGDHLECGYHGMTFDCRGHCTKAPGGEKIPSAAVVRWYPLESRYGLLWIWMGDPVRADAATIFQVDHWGDPAWGVNQGDAMSIDCNYLYMADNLLDPTHVSFVHQSSFGNAACEDAPLTTTVGENGITVWRWMTDVEPAPFYAQFLQFKGNCDRKQQYEVRYPGHALIKAIFAPAGTGGEGKALPAETFVMDSYNFMTPIDENTTRYYWFQMRNFAPDDADVSRRFAESVRFAFSEDRAILQAVHKGMARKRTPNLDLKIDVGQLRFRRRLAQMIEAEASAGDAGAAVAGRARAVTVAA